MSNISRYSPYIKIVFQDGFLNHWFKYSYLKVPAVFHSCNVEAFKKEIEMETLTGDCEIFLKNSNYTELGTAQPHLLIFIKRWQKIKMLKEDQFAKERSNCDKISNGAKNPNNVKQEELKQRLIILWWG